MSHKLALTEPLLGERDARNCGVLRASARRFITRHPGGGDDRVSGTDADRHDDIYHNGSSGFCCNADRAEMADLRLCIGGATGPTDKITAVIGDPPKRFGVTECENIDKAQASLKSSGREAIAPQTKKTNMMPIA
jgi:hypothetical protein